MIEDQLKLAKLACRQMQKVDKYTKMNALDAISKGLLENIEYILLPSAHGCVLSRFCRWSNRIPSSAG